MERRLFLKSMAAAGAATLAAPSIADPMPSPTKGRNVVHTGAKGQSSCIKQATTLLVRPAARGGKYLGHDAANANNLSALIAIQSSETGKIVEYCFARAPTAESAGPENLMAPLSRSAPYASNGNTVQVQLKVDISEPTDFRVLVFGPLKHLDQARLVQSDITVLPGVDIGTTPQNLEGLVIEIPGLCISNVMGNWRDKQVTCSAMVTMMCGCPINDIPDWFWPASDFSVQLVTYMHSGATLVYQLAFDKKPGLISTFAGAWPNQAAQGDTVAQAWIYAAEPKLGNQGKYKLFPTSSTLQPLEVREMLREAC